MSVQTVTIAERRAVRCPNEYCDDEDGCCVCEHTGWVYEYVLDQMIAAAIRAKEGEDRHGAE